MEASGSRLVRLELKYCERCGALWLRLRDSDTVLCGRCTKAMAGLPAWQGGDSAEVTGGTELLVDSAFWGEGGNA